MAAGEGVGGAIGGRARLAFGRARSGGVAGVFAIGSGLLVSGHGFCLLAPGDEGKCGREGESGGFGGRWLRELEKIYFRDA